MLEALPAGPPRLVGPYRLLARLGAGGMGEVHLACRADAPTADPYRMVAVKTVREELELDQDFRVRFRREITAARAVDSPWAARLVDADADAPAPWLATEYVPGPSLAEAVARAGALPAAAVRELGGALARALAAVHGAQVLHRDLKPANVLLGAAGPKLIDFGIAQAFGATALTSTGLVVGSPGFMSPEHLVGGRAVVPASDVFCLGAVLAFAASGEGPFQDAEMAAVIYRISRAEAELSGVPAELRPVVERCLRLDPAERPSAAELVELLGSEDAGDAAGVEDAGGAGDASAGRVFPWPAGVLSLLAEYGEAAREVGEAAASGAGLAELPTMAPVVAVPYSPTAAVARPGGPGPAGPEVPEPRARRRWARIGAAALAVAVVATAGVVLLNRQGGGGGAAGGGPTASGAPSVSASGPGAPRTLSQVVLPYGGEGRTGDFGKDTAGREHRPAGWSPFIVETGQEVDACALAPRAVVCAGSGGSAVALRASDGTKLWAVPPRTRPEDFGILATPGYPAVVGDTVYVTGRAGVTAYGLADGKERGRIPAPTGGWAQKSSDLRDGVLYSSHVLPGGDAAGIVTAVRLDGRGGGRTLWRHELDQVPEETVVGAGRVYVVGGRGLVALDLASGRETARAPEAVSCFRPVVGKRVVLCEESEGGVAVLDARTLRPLRTLAPGLEVAGGPALRETDGGGGGTVAVVGDPGESWKQVTTYDLASGRELMRAEVPAAAERVYFAGDRLLVAGGREMYSFGASGRDSRGRTFEIDLPQNIDDKRLTSVDALVSGGAFFLPFADVLVSGYVP
ncbi:protein kinase [Streptomyces sp. NPDC053541]|uniref:serine/threonine-protein kinase n=1 Tax=Streptomyces sp. NPDC053541 TaxID=3365709 RepID=UPI0037D52C92